MSCPKCSDGISYPEKFVLGFLSQLNIDFEFQQTFEWSKNTQHINPKLKGAKRYDFYLPFLNVIIETHGRHHYEEKRGSRNSWASKTVKDEQENDELKEKLANENSIESGNYIVLNCSESKMEYIKNSILLSRLSIMLDLKHIDWSKCHETACNSNLIKTACELWKQRSEIDEICEILKLSKNTIRTYLKQGETLGWCDYNPKDGNKVGGKKREKEIVQLTFEGKFVGFWDSIRNVQEVLGIQRTSISKVCNGKRNKAGGFKWMFKEDYEGLLK